MIVLDTNVVSELMQPARSVDVAAWVATQDTSAMRMTSITIAEVRYGVERLPRGRRKELLAAAATRVLSAWADGVLDFDTAAADEYASLCVARERAGRRISAFDAQIAAICRAHSATLATRNVKDFRDTGIDVVDPWRGF